MNILKIIKRIGLSMAIILVLLINITACRVADTNEDKNLIQTLYPAYKYEKNQKLWGLIDVSGNFVVKPQYEAIDIVKDSGLFRFYKDEKLGIMDENGNEIMQPTYFYISDFSEGVAIGFDGTNYNAIDQHGNILFKKEEYIGNFCNDIAWYQIKDSDDSILYGYLDKKGNTVIKPQYLYTYDFSNERAIVRTQDEKYAVIDKSGKILYQTADKVLYDLNQDIAVYFDKGKNLFGYISVNGDIVREAEFSYASKFENGMAIVAVTNDLWEQKFGIINNSGNFIIEPKYATLARIGEGMFSASLKSLAGAFDMFSEKAIIDDSGNVLTDFLYYDMGYYNDGAISVCDGHSTFFLDKLGKKMENLPNVEGAGTMTIDNGIIKAEIDEDILYFNKESVAFWKPDNVMKLESGIEVNIKKYRPDRCLLVKYPQLSNMPDINVQDRLNNELKEYFISEHTESVQEEEVYTEDITVGFSIDEYGDILRIQMDAYVYPMGAAHGQPYRQNLHINIQNGNLYLLKDLFKQGSEYQKRLTDLINIKIKEDNDKEDLLYSVESIDTITSEQNFITQKDALVIYFHPYEIAAYAAGFPTFKIPYDQIMDIIDIESEFWKALKK